MKINTNVILLLGVLFVTSCSLFLEPDISNDVVILNAPYDGMKSTVLTTTFWWEYVSDADGYNLQIVSPSFDSIAQVVLDTNVSANKFVYTLNPGSYEWGIFAYNSGYSTVQFTRSFSIDSTEGVSGQFVNLVSPAPNFNTNKLSIKFEWNRLPMDASYILSIRDSSFSEENKEFQNSYDENSIIVELPEGKYTWGVMAYKDQSSSNYSKRYLIVDTTKPGRPQISQPAEGDTLNESPYKIIWGNQGSSLSKISNVIWIHKDTITNPHQEYIADENEFSLTNTTLTNGKYVIQVKSVDAAGNIGAFSEPRKFYLNKD